MHIAHLHELVSEDFEAVNALITERVQSPIELIKDLSSHIVKGGGKRLRPLLTLLTSKACLYEGKAHIKLASMIELFHTATLLHDDVIDESALRRGQKSANKIWGSKACVLVGDYLFAQALQLMVEVASIDVVELMIGISPQIGSGEILQFSKRKHMTLTRDEYFEVIRGKTSLLFAASAMVGAMVSPVNKATQKSLYKYGLHLGNAFQMTDDALDYSSDAETLGKNQGDDLISGKVTLPLLHVIEHGTRAQRSKIKTSLEQGTLEFLPDVLQAIKETKAIEYTLDYASTEMNLAIEALDCLPDSEYKSALIDLAKYAVEREY